MSTNPSRAEQPTTDIPATSGYRWYVLTVLTFTYACANVDRNVVLALVEPIKQEFLLSDTQMGLITGVAFSVFFVIAAIPKMNLKNVGDSKPTRMMVFDSITGTIT